MSDNEKVDKTEPKDSSVEVSPVKRVKRLEKKPLTPTKGRVSKPARQRTVSPRMKAKQVALATTRNPQQQQRQNKDSFYRGALLGSFLGATLSTVITNAIAKLLG
ncbi:hypothetical protein ZYGR_0AD01110 [Zygosaccharomyces rouxii]|uniref:ZYRO0G08426p n=2 Tax=Zygosaccharomyces rouxii TaxID=4956 RepID=C5DZZ5_ZYGRC|nr:uncharacterized protein ZYRO0G08426g [Zygosaccharomyces rouxii]GAV50928.1 hypothetical protein ZYGR_0AD01110 [Zygosaccharomyces rouxii]CAR29429.1 ZYRO0G08426p [Zygosaccharomyces rouxii]